MSIVEPKSDASFVWQSSETVLFHTVSSTVWQSSETVLFHTVSSTVQAISDDSYKQGLRLSDVRDGEHAGKLRTRSAMRVSSLWT